MVTVEIIKLFYLLQIVVKENRAPLPEIPQIEIIADSEAPYGVKCKGTDIMVGKHYYFLL